MPSYEKNKSSGLWSVRFREVSSEDGQTHQKRLSGFKTKKEAQNGYEEYITEQKRLEEEVKNQPPPEEADPNEMLFGDLFERYMSFKRSRLKDTSLYDTDKKMRAKILPFFKGMRMKDITPATILEWMDTLEGYSYIYRKNLLSMLKMVYNYGENYFEIKNVARKVDKPRNLEGKKEMLFWSPDEFRLFISKVDREEYALFFRFLYFSGCRRGEALAIKWEDIDLKNCTARIYKSISNKATDAGKSYKVTTPKNESSNRTISLPSHYCAVLKKYRGTQEVKDEFVFGGKDPLPLTSIDRVMKRAANAAGVKKIRVHDLRHSCASLLIHKGVSIVAVSRHLGHATVEQTLNTYSHMMPDDHTMILRTLNEVEESISKPLSE